MILRIKFDRGRPVHKKHGKNRHVALAFSALFTPLALMAYVLGLWRLASDMGLSGSFVITGLFSHWQIWVALGALIQAGGSALNHYGSGRHFQVPRVLMFRPRPEKSPSIPVRRVSSR
jgi:hypothetical protein